VVSQSLSAIRARFTSAAAKGERSRPVMYFRPKNTPKTRRSGGIDRKTSV
jgi:hypothetical protein